PALSALLGAGSLGLRMLLRQFAIQRQWLVCVGQRSALARTAHLICELLVRLEEAGRSDGRSFEFPMTQIDLADALGLSSVHVNRTVQTLRREGLISWRGRTVEVHDRPGLESVARFDGEYLVQLEA
ncbi:MAG: Crp/Fnr family transcriptional regulator, partial [Phenylobacterium sp.]|nr:Crp/Fnr family transcriptional regulator [Phenylobacterium sp.]